MMDDAFFNKHGLATLHSIVIFRRGTWLVHLVNSSFWHEAGKVSDDVLYIDSFNVWCQQPADGSDASGDDDGTGGETKRDPLLAADPLLISGATDRHRDPPEVIRYAHAAQRAKEENMDEGDNEGKDNHGLFFSAAAAIALLAVIAWVSLQPDAAVPSPPSAP